MRNITNAELRERRDKEAQVHETIAQSNKNPTTKESEVDEERGRGEHTQFNER